MGEQQWVVVCIGLTTFGAAGCSKEQSKSSGTAPETVAVAGSAVTIGVQRGSLRASAEVSEFRITQAPIRVGDYAACLLPPVTTGPSPAGSVGTRA